MMKLREATYQFTFQAYFVTNKIGFKITSYDKSARAFALIYGAFLKKKRIPAGLVEVGQRTSVWVCGHLIILILIRGSSRHFCPQFLILVLFFDLEAILCVHCIYWRHT